ncbi:hypothetical protein RvY_16498 [Ramazzottius varieornatus]|uniref:Uncharacterized protein n=1 Tax=Ramazzottius varieornatus TaxID=947166 RepID=A0A1D1W679_RAMVA|nr:hypothetical protein RvY_16498 [Ramazzottius varieornatus]
MAKWLGTFQDDRSDDRPVPTDATEGEEGDKKPAAPEPKEQTDDSLLPTITFSKQGADYVQTTTLPSSGQKTEVKFQLNKKTSSKNKAGTTISTTYKWDEETRTLSTEFETSEGKKFEMNFIFDEDYNKLVKHRKTAQVEAKQKMHRIK